MTDTPDTLATARSEAAPDCPDVQGAAEGEDKQCGDTTPATPPLLTNAEITELRTKYDHAVRLLKASHLNVALIMDSLENIGVTMEVADGKTSVVNKYKKAFDELVAKAQAARASKTTMDTDGQPQTQPTEYGQDLTGPDRTGPGRVYDNLGNGDAHTTVGATEEYED